MEMDKDIEKGNQHEEAKDNDSDDCQSSLAIGVNLEKNTSYQSSPIHEPLKIHTTQTRQTLSLHTTQRSEKSGAPARRVTTAQDWTGPDDPENPYNWPMWKRVWHTVPPGIIAFAVTFGSSVYTPAYPEVARQFHVSNTAALLGLTLYVAGLAFGPMIAAPISETFGRLVVYRLSLPISMLFTLGAGFSNSFGSFLVCRFLAGTTGSPVLAVGAGTNADLFPPKQRAIATSLFLLAPFAGPALGPIVGGFAAQYKSWRWTQWCTLFVCVGVYLISLPSQETYKKAILLKRSRKLGLPPPPKLPPGWAGVKFIFTVTLLRPLHMLFFEPIVGFMSLYTAFTFSVLFAFFAAFPYVFKGVYHFSTSQAGLAFLAVGIGIMLSAATSILLDRILYQKQHRKAVAEGKGLVAPEHRLYSAMIGSIGVPVGLFWFAWTAKTSVHWIVPILGGIPFAWGNSNIFTSAALYLVDVYGPLNGASAMAANGVARYIMGAVFPLFTVQMYERLGIAWATSLLGFIALAMMPIPWVLFKWGPKVRAKSHYETMKA